MTTEVNMKELRDAIWKTVCECSITNADAAELFCALAGHLAKKMIEDPVQRQQEALRLAGILANNAGLALEVLPDVRAH